MSLDSNRPSLALLLTITLLVAAGLLISFYHYGKPDFYQNAPAQMAADVRLLARSGAWLVPTDEANNPILGSPPLYTWAARVAHWFEPDLKRAVRMPAAVCSVLLILLTAGWFLRHAIRYGRDDNADAPSEGFALLAGLMVAASPVLYSLGREATSASMFALLYLGAAFCWAESLEARRSFYAGFSPRYWLLWGYALAGVAMLVKGPLPLLLLWIPYLCAARSYHLRGFDPVHLLGLVLAALIGGWWPAAVALAHPTLTETIVREWVTLKAFNGPEGEIGLLVPWLAANDLSPQLFVWKLVLSTLPWCVVAIVMTTRVLRKKDRSPTLVYWMWTLFANTVVLALLSRPLGTRMMLLPFIALLATDAFYRWNFESGWARGMRVFLRVTLIAAIALGIFIAALLGTAFWIVIFALIPLAWMGWVWNARRNDIMYSPWETSTRLAAMVVLVLFTTLGMILSKWDRRLNFHRPVVSFYQRVDDQLDAHDGPVYSLGEHLPALVRLYLDPAPKLAPTLAEVKPELGQAPLVLATKNIPELLANKSIEPLVLMPGRHNEPPSKGLFRLHSIPTSGTQATSATWQPAPYHLALLGNSGQRNKNQREVGKRLAKSAEKLRLQDVLLLGNNIYGPGFFDHLDFIGSFEEPYERLLRRGVTFHALLGHEDNTFPPLQLNYGPFNMDGQRYYSRVLNGGRVEIFMLDAEGLRGEHQDGTHAQLDWLDNAVRQSSAMWKLVALHPALLTAANQGKADKDLGEWLLPHLNILNVDLVVWSGGFYYERSRVPGTRPLLLNAGWSGNWTRTGFRHDPAHQYGYGEGVAGFVLLEFTPNELGWKAINRRGLVVDEGRMNKSGEIVFSNERTRPEPGHGRLLPAQDAAATSVTATTGTTESATAGTTTSAERSDPDQSDSPTTVSLDREEPTTRVTLRNLDVRKGE